MMSFSDSLGVIQTTFRDVFPEKSAAAPVETTGQTGRKRKRRSDVPICSQQAPHCIVAVVSHSSGRWHKLLDAPGGDTLFRTWCNTGFVELGFDDCDVPPGDVYLLHGFAVVCAYNFLMPGEDSSECPSESECQLQAIMLSLLRKSHDHRCQTIGFSSSVVKGAAHFALPIAVTEDIGAMTSAQVSKHIIDVAKESGTLAPAVVPNRTQDKFALHGNVCFQTLIDLWVTEFGVPRAHAMPSLHKLTPRLATLMCHGGVPFDIVSFVMRDPCRTTIRPNVPSNSEVLS